MDIVVDFDETITEADTIGLLLETPYLKTPNLQPKPIHFTDVYVKALTKYKNEVSPVTNLQDELKYQKNLNAVEMTSITELEKKGIFKGMTEDSLRQQASKVVIRPHFVDFMKSCSRFKIPITILSINWTSILIAQVLSSHGIKPQKIILNELVFENGICTGKFDPTINIRTGYDKYTALQAMRNKHRKLIYIGDSRTDLLSILTSDVGIILETGSLLKKLPWNIEVQHLSQYKGGGVYKSNWRELHDFVQKF